MIVGGRKKAVPLKTAARSREFKPLKASPEMQAVYARCSGPTPVSLAAGSKVPEAAESARVFSVPAVRNRR